jgi:hypothetical protein
MSDRFRVRRDFLIRLLLALGNLPVRLGTGSVKMPADFAGTFEGVQVPHDRVIVEPGKVIRVDLTPSRSSPRLRAASSRADIVSSSCATHADGTSLRVVCINISRHVLVKGWACPETNGTTTATDTNQYMIHTTYKAPCPISMGLYHAPIHKHVLTTTCSC